MSKFGIFCESCPIRTHCHEAQDQKPVTLGYSEPVSETVARHHLGHNIPAVRYHTLDSQGTVIGGNASVVIAAEVSQAEAITAFSECQAPAPNSIKLLGLKIGLGQKCMGLVALDEQIHWSVAENGSQDLA